MSPALIANCLAGMRTASAALALALLLALACVPCALAAGATLRAGARSEEVMAIMAGARVRRKERFAGRAVTACA